MKDKVFLLLYQSRNFWKIKRYFEAFFFDIDRRKLFVSSSVFREKQDIPYYKKIARYSIKPLLLTLCFMVFLQFLDYIMLSIKPDIKIFFAYNFGWRPKFISVSDSEYVTFLTAISAIGGLFIGLYYAALSSIQSALYSKLPSNIRSLLSAEKSGNAYMRFLAYVTFLSICLVALRLVGFEKIYVAPFVMSILSAMAIFAFIELGKRAFNLFDPTELAESIFANLSYLARGATVNGKYFKRKEFQQHCNKLAHNEIATLITLYDFALEQKELNNQGLFRLNVRSIAFLSLYANIKKQIQTDSLWFDQKYLHKDWYKLNNLNIYSSTGSAPQPEKTSNLLWLEESIWGYVLKSVIVNLQLRRYQTVFNMMSQIEQYLHFLTLELEVEAAINFYGELKKEILACLSTTNNETKPEILAILDHLASIEISIFLAFAQKILSNNLKDEERLKNIDWLSKKDIYRHGFEAYLLGDLEFLGKTINYEYAIENKIITPYWFQNEVIKRVKTKKFAESIKRLLTEDLFLITDILDDKAWYKAAYIARHWEYYQKVFFNLTDLEKVWIDLKASRKVDFIEWGEIDFEDLKSKLATKKQNILESMGIACVQLGLEKHVNEYPDYFGRFTTVLGDEILNTLLSNDIKSFKTLYSFYFVNCFTAFDRHKPNGIQSDVLVEQNLKIAITPILELVEISGYAKLMSEFYENQEYWNTVVAAWDVYFEKTAMKLEFFVAAIGLSQGNFSIMPRDEMKYHWMQKIKNFLDSKIKKDEFYEKDNSFFITPKVIALHDSPLVRIFVEDRYSHYDGIDIFIHFYLEKKDASLDFGRAHRDISRSITGSEEKMQKYKRQQDEN